MKKQIQVIEIDTLNIVKTIDVAGRNEREIEKIERGMNINLNHEQYFTQIIGGENNGN